MAKPRLLILDEPCAGLDPAAREHFLQFLQRIGHRPNAPTLVLVTHHVEEIMPVFSHVLILKDGRALATGAKPATLTGKILSQAFGERAKLKEDKNRYTLAIQTKSRGVI
jgi:iron complex transport system ATP-binding protein